MAGYVAVGLGLAILILCLSILGPVIAPTAHSLLGITVDTTALTLYFFIFATLYNSILLSTIVLYDRRLHSIEGVSSSHNFTVMVPCRNEQAVVERTVRTVLGLDYPRERFEVVVVNDGSTDSTGEIVRGLMSEFPNLSIIDVDQEESGRGKGAALNAGFETLLKTSRFCEFKEAWIIGVFDADGVPDSSILKKASSRFLNPRIGAVQCLVRIIDAKRSVLTTLQDIEFVTFAKVTQFARSVFGGAVALGGNGQFVRARTLEAIRLPNGEYWRNGALTEDLDLGTRVLLQGEENAFLSTVSVHQHGVTTLSALYKQRTRWSWGALQCFRTYALTLKPLRHPIPLVKKLDLMYYLSAAILPPLILVVWALSLLAVFGILIAYNPFPSYFMIANSISFFPLIGYGLWSVRKEYNMKFMIPILFLTNAYTYHWVVCTAAAMLRIARGEKPRWVVTKKAQQTPAVVSLKAPLKSAHDF